MKKSKKIYLDYASATPIDGDVLKVFNKALKENFANASAIHDMAVENKKVLDIARKDVARFFDAHSNEIIFTSGSTESNNIVIQNFKNIITTNIEHASILEPARLVNTTFVGVEASGIIDPKKIKKALTLETELVSVMYANNEIGTIQPIKEIAKEIRHFNKTNNTKILFHTDATQAVNYLDMNVERLGVDIMSFNAGKIYGPKGIGALYIRRRTPIKKIIFGGDQENGIRAGTENLPAILAFAEALKITEKIKDKENKRLKKLQEYFVNKLLKNQNSLGPRVAALNQTLDNFNSSKVKINGDLENRLPNNINITIPKIPSDLLVIELSARGVMVSAKSACKSGDEKASHVIQAIRESEQGESLLNKEVDGSIRFSMGRETTKQDIDYTLKSLSQILSKLKKWYT
ncbi:MAG: cysteine desulfurase family protein [Candidatus Nomurabacteria bacterium]|nr:cysteine desulfurase family protein [Candidatus Nomurabacteria bacterium]